jgi:hypothetical protein
MAIDNESVTDVEEPLLERSEEVAETAETLPQGKPIPGMDIFTVVERSIMQQAEVGSPPQYAFIRNDIYLLVMTAQPNLGFMRWVDESKGLDCLLLPFDPLEGQNQFKLAYSYEEAHDIYISSFPEGTFSYLPPAQANSDTTPVSDDASLEPTIGQVVETNNG